jgi:hypothetical protein
MPDDPHPAGRASTAVNPRAYAIRRPSMVSRKPASDVKPTRLYADLTDTSYLPGPVNSSVLQNARQSWSAITMPQRPPFHLHSWRPRERWSPIRRLIGRLIPTQTYQVYQLRSFEDVATACWCPICQSGTLFGRGSSDHVPTLCSIIGRDTPPEVGTIDVLWRRLQ